MQMQAKTSQCLKGAALVQPRVQPRAARRSSTAVRAAETKEKESKPKAEKKPFSPPALDGKRHQMMCCPWWPWATLKQCSLAQGSQSTAPVALGSRLS